MLLVTFSSAERIVAYADQHQLPFDVVRDATRDGYRSFGLGRGSFARVWGWKAARRYYQIWRGEGLADMRRPDEDTLQLGGDFVIGRDGTLVYGYWGEGPDDRPPVEDLVAATHRRENS